MAALPIPARELFINGRWVAPVRGKYLDVISPATEAVIGRIPAGAEEEALAEQPPVRGGTNRSVAVVMN